MPYRPSGGPKQPALREDCLPPPRTVGRHCHSHITGYRTGCRRHHTQLIRNFTPIHPDEPKSVKGGKTGRSPVDRGGNGSKLHLIADATSILLTVTLTGGNRNDVTQLVPLLQAVPSVRGKRGRPRRRPEVVLGDRGNDHDKYRGLVRGLGVKPLIARRGTEHGSGLAAQR